MGQKNKPDLCKGFPEYLTNQEFIIIFKNGL